MKNPVKMGNRIITSTYYVGCLGGQIGPSCFQEGLERPVGLAGSYVIREKDCEWNLELIQVVYQVATVPGVLTKLFPFAI